MKRLFDICGAAIGILLLFPLGLVLALAVKLSDGGSVFYRQTRVGQFGRPFRILKFRSMVLNAEKLGPAVTQGKDPRITGIGRILRKTKLDELPQLWNVLVGEMSFVGPRPEVSRYVEKYTPEQRRVLDLKPGITDLASLIFRDEEGILRGVPDVEDFYIRYCMPRKIALNLEHAARASVLADLSIILRTVFSLGTGHGSQPIATENVKPGVALVGTSEKAVLAVRNLLQSGEALPIVAAFDDDPHKWGKCFQGIRIAGMPECLLSAEWQKRMCRILIALPEKQASRAQEIEKTLHGMNVTIWTESGPAPNAVERTVQART